jgi:hypothetical protein
MAANGRKRKGGKFKPGDWVVWVSGNSRFVAQVLEDRGVLTKSGERFYFLWEPVWYAEPREYDFPESDLEPATEADLARRYPPEATPAHASKPG